MYFNENRIHRELHGHFNKYPCRIHRELHGHLMKCPCRKSFIHGYLMKCPCRNDLDTFFFKYLYKQHTKNTILMLIRDSTFVQTASICYN